VRVAPDGVVTLPLVGAVPVAGQTVRAIEELLRDRYNTYIYEPHVTVRVEEFRRLRVSVLGYVQRPGFYQLEGQGTLLEALSVAGGLDERAGTTVEITRRTRRGVRTHAVDLDRVVHNGDMRLNVPVRAGDVIYVPAAGTRHTSGDGVAVGEEVES
jgi:polysaccharide export outer membrane protein